MRPSSMPRRITSVLCAGMLLVVLGSAVVHWLVHRVGGRALSALDHLTGYDQSGVLPTAYASFMLLACSVVLGYIAHTKFVRGGIFVRHWGALALLFAALGADKALGVHHRLMPLARSIQAMLHVSNVMMFVGIGVVGLLAYAAYARFMRCLAPNYRRQFLLATAIFLAGAVFYDKFSSLFISRLNDNVLLTQVLLAFEDMLEIGGAVLFLHALLQYLAELELPLLRRRFRAASPTAPEMASGTVDFSPKPQ